MAKKKLTVAEAAAKFFNDDPPTPENYQGALDAMVRRYGKPIPKALQLRKGKKR